MDIQNLIPMPHFQELVSGQMEHGKRFSILTKSMLGIMALASVLVFSESQVAAQDWMTRGSYYTHNPVTKKRVHQYAPDPKVIHTPNPHVRVYRHQRSRISVDGSFESFHTVEAYGGIVRPYGEWQRPYRPYSVPYSDWAYGSPFGHLAYPRRTNPTLPPGIYAPYLIPRFGVPGGGGVPFIGPRP